MQAVRFLLAYGVFSAFGILVSLFLVQNTQAERIAFFGQEVPTNLAWIILGASAFGFLLALLLLMPGRIAASLHIWTLRREAKELDEELAWQDERREDLLAHHERLLSGHEWLLDAYRRVIGERDQVVRERDALRIQVASFTTISAHASQVALRAVPQVMASEPPRPDRSAAWSAAGARLSAAPVAPSPIAPRPKGEPSVPLAVAQEAWEDDEEEFEEYEDEDAADEGAAVLEEEVRPAVRVLTPANERLEAAPGGRAAAALVEAERDEERPLHRSAALVALLSSRMRSVNYQLTTWATTMSKVVAAHLHARRVVDHLAQANAAVRRSCADGWARAQERYRDLLAREAERQNRVPSPTQPRGRKDSPDSAWLR